MNIQHIFTTKKKNVIKHYFDFSNSSEKSLI